MGADSAKTNLEWFIAHADELGAMYGECYAVIGNQSVLCVCSTRHAAEQAARENKDSDNGVVVQLSGEHLPTLGWYETIL